MFKKLSILILFFSLVVPAMATDPNLVAWWEFDEGSGIIAADSSENGINGELISNPEWSEDGKSKDCLFFDGNEAYVLIPYQDCLVPGTGSFTYTFWVNLDETASTNGTTSWDIVLGQRESGSNGMYIGANRSQGSSDEAGIKFMLGDTSSTRKDTGYEIIPLGEWVFVACVLDRENNVHKISVDGGQTWSTQTPPSGPILPNMDLSIGTDVGVSNYWTHGLIDDVALFNRALSVEEIQQIRHTAWPEFASAPSPEDGAAEVSRETVLTWTPGEDVAAENGHTFYFSVSFEEVNNGVSGIDLSDCNYTLSHRLEFGTTYYWRVDENSMASDNTAYQGDVWSFTTEAYSYAVTPVAATASGSLTENNGPEKTIDESGLTEDLHNTTVTDMWVSDGLPAWIEYEFDRIEKLDEMWVWNSNQTIESFIGYGANEVVIETSVDGTNWTVLENVPTFSQAAGTADYAHNTVVDFNDTTAKYVRLTINTVHGVAPQTGLSEVRFFSLPVYASEPNPTSGTTDVEVDATLKWVAGREADQHELYLGTDSNALSCVAVVESNEYTASLDLDQSYYWQIVEINDLEVPTSWASDVWSFTTSNHIVIDDMESYQDDPNSAIWATWVDGQDDATNGAIVGDGNAPETTIVHNGSQSLPLYYSNIDGVDVSETTFTFDTAQDWTLHNIQTLTLWFAGNGTNVPGQLYVKVNGVQVNYDGDANDLTLTPWQSWNIELSQLAIDLQDVTTICIGIEGADAEGLLYFDDISLYPYVRQIVTPFEPNTTALIGYWKFDGDTLDSSGLGNDGIAEGSPDFNDGLFDQAIYLDGIDDYVTLNSVADDITDSNITLSAWIHTTEDDDWTWWFSCNTASLGNVLLLGLIDGEVVVYENGAEGYTTAQLNDGQWHHIAYSRVGDVGSLYVDGALDLTHAASFVFSGDDLWSIGQEYDGGGASDFLRGNVDEVQMYDRGLSDAEIAGLAGRTESFDKSFE